MSCEGLPFILIGVSVMRFWRLTIHCVFGQDAYGSPPCDTAKHSFLTRCYSFTRGPFVWLLLLFIYVFVVLWPSTSGVGWPALQCQFLCTHNFGLITEKKFISLHKFTFMFLIRSKNLGAIKVGTVLLFVQWTGRTISFLFFFSFFYNRFQKFWILFIVNQSHCLWNSRREMCLPYANPPL